MSLQAPNLDDRSFHDLVAEAKRMVRERCPEWTDLGPSDPGTTLIELYAFLTEVMIYRINRLPEKAYIEFLRLMGVQLVPPSAARVELVFSRSEGSDQTVEIPRGTRVTVARGPAGGDPPVFTTAVAATLAAGAKTTAVLAYHCRLVAGEDLGDADGTPGQSVHLQHAPVIAPTGDELDLVVGVEMASEPADRTVAINHRGVPYRIWREVEHFTQVDDADDHRYVADRASGLITFAPAVRRTGAATANGLSENPQALAAIPPAGHRIRAWYRCGGGPEGNVAAHSLTVLKDPIPGLRVDNPEAAVGGSEGESLDNALQRGPQELHSLNRAVTARDYEAVALREGSIGRARALAHAERWRFAAPGTVQLLLVPQVHNDPTAPHYREELENAQTSEALQRVGEAIDERRPLGTDCVIDWYRYKPVSVRVRLVLHPQEDAASVQARVAQRLHEIINPLGHQPMARPIHASDIYHTALTEPGVRYADRVRFRIDEAPESSVAAIAADPYHSDVWYAGAGSRLFRSMDSGDGWEALARFDDEAVVRLSCCHSRPGLLAALCQSAGDAGAISRVRLSRDCGHNWEAPHELGFEVNDLAWLTRGDERVLLLATDDGLYQLPPGSGPLPVPVDSAKQGLAFYAVATVESPLVGTQVAVAAHNTQGVYLCNDEQLETFRPIGLDGRDVRVLAGQRVGPRAFLWAGLAAVGGDDGDGCLRRELRRDTEGTRGWSAMGAGWRGGSCLALAIRGEHVVAATYHSGVLAIDSAAKSPEWHVPAIDCGLPLRDTERLLYKINDVAATAETGTHEGGLTVLAAGPRGVFRSRDGATTFQAVSGREFSDYVSIGDGFLFCSAKHDVEVVHDATR
jgi:hypothetical protein